MAGGQVAVQATAGQWLDLGWEQDWSDMEIPKRMKNKPNLREGIGTAGIKVSSHWRTMKGSIGMRSMLPWLLN